MKLVEGGYIVKILPCDYLNTFGDVDKKLTRMCFVNNASEIFEFVGEVSDNLDFPFECNFFDFLDSKKYIWNSYSDIVGLNFVAEVFYEDACDCYPTVIFTDFFNNPEKEDYYEISGI